MKSFKPFQLDDANQCLWREGAEGARERIHLTPTSFALLSCLVQHAGRLVTHDEILDSVWPDTDVQPGVVSHHILGLRAALQDDARRPRFIESVARRGYRFIAEVATTSAPSTRLVGRQQLLAALLDMVRDTAAGRRRTVLVTGEPGIGKTALVDAALHAGESENVRIVRGQCIEADGVQEAYYPVLEALGQLCHEDPGVVDDVRQTAPSWLIQMPSLMTAADREHHGLQKQGETRPRMLRELIHLLERISSQVPLVLTLEDIQWADPATVDVVSALSRRRTPARLLLIVTGRWPELGPERPWRAMASELLSHGLCVRLPLQGLDQSQVEAWLVDRSTGPSLPAGLADTLCRASGGNPACLHFLLEHVLERRLLCQDEGGWRLAVPVADLELELPETLRAVIEVHLRRLSSEEVRALELASLAGPEFSAASLAALSDLDAARLESLYLGVSLVRRLGTPTRADGNRGRGLSSSTRWFGRCCTTARRQSIVPASSGGCGRACPSRTECYRATYLPAESQAACRVAARIKSSAALQRVACPSAKHEYRLNHAATLFLYRTHSDSKGDVLTDL